jgi:hypothetical protein
LKTRRTASSWELPVKTEWAALGKRRRDKSSEQAFSELLDTVLHITPRNRPLRSRTMVNMGSLTGKVAIVTGASKSIGSGITEAIAAAGARVAVNYSSDRKGAERVAQAIIDAGGEAVAIGADVSRAADVAQLFQEVDTANRTARCSGQQRWGFRFGPLAEITEESFHLHLINVLGRFSRCKRRLSASALRAGASSWNGQQVARVRVADTAHRIPRIALAATPFPIWGY